MATAVLMIRSPGPIPGVMETLAMGLRIHRWCSIHTILLQLQVDNNAMCLLTPIDFV